MLLTRIRGTREQLRALAASGLRLHRSGVRRVSDTLFEVPAVLEEPEAGLLGFWGYEVIVQGDVKELLSQRLKPAKVRAQPFMTHRGVVHRSRAHGSQAKNAAWKSHT